MDYVLAVTTPIYLLIATGFMAVRLGWMTPPDMRVLGRFTAQFGVPALLFRAISHQQLGSVLNADYLTVYAGGSLTALGLIMLVAWRGRGRPFPMAALQGLGAAGSNSAFIGYPIVLQVIGPTAAIALALCTLVENLLITPLALILADSAGAQKNWRDVGAATVSSMLRNPMIMAIFAGLAVSALEWHIPSVLDQTVGLAAAAAPPTALFVIGGTLVGLKLTGIRGDIALITSGKLLLHPLCVLLFVLLLPPQQPLLRAAAVMFAAMPMMSIYPVLAQKHGHDRLAAAALLAGTVLSFVSISVLIGLLPSQWLAGRP